MFLIKSVTLNNFKSYLGTHKWVLPEVAGLYFLTGKNEVNPRLGRNGAGKSTLLDAITWCLYGKTTRGLKAGDVVAWGENSCSVTVELIIGDEDLKIEATQNPNSLAVNGVLLDREALVTKLRLNYESFCYSVILPQFGEAFFDLLPSAKLSLFSQIMELDYWLGLSNKAQTETLIIETNKQICEREIAKYKGQFEVLSIDLAKFSKKRDEWTDNHKDHLLALNGELRELKAKVGSYLAKINAAKKAEDAAKKQILEADEVVAEQRKEHGELITKRSDIEKHLAVITNDIETAKKVLKRFKSLKAVCPTCLQTVSIEHLRNEEAKLEVEFRQTYEIHGQIFDELFDINRKIERSVESIEFIENELKSLVSKRNKAESDGNLAKAEKSFTETNIRRLDAEIASEEAKQNEFEVLFNQQKQQICKLGLTLAAKQKEATELDEKHAAVSYWVNGFKRLRLSIIEETLRTLELEVNNNLASLGLADWRIEFDIERENKGGGVTKGFTVLIYSPTEGPIKWGCWSGGETQLLRLAGALGLANLIMERVGLTNSIEFFDEVSSHLSQDAVLGMIETLHQRAISTNRRIWVVDHNAVSFGDFEGVLTIVKDEKGSHIK